MTPRNINLSPQTLADPLRQQEDLKHYTAHICWNYEVETANNNSETRHDDIYILMTSPLSFNITSNYEKNSAGEFLDKISGASQALTGKGLANLFLQSNVWSGSSINGISISGFVYGDKGIETLCVLSRTVLPSFTDNKTLQNAATGVLKLADKAIAGVISSSLTFANIFKDSKPNRRYYSDRSFTTAVGNALSEYSSGKITVNEDPKSGEVTTNSSFFETNGAGIASEFKTVTTPLGYNPLSKKTPITVKIGNYFETNLLLVNYISFTFSQEVGLSGRPLYAKVKIDLSFCRPVSYGEFYSMFLNLEQSKISIQAALKTLENRNRIRKAIEEIDALNKSFLSSLKAHSSAIRDKIASSYKVNGKTYTKPPFD